MIPAKPVKPLGIKAYGSIPHLPGSRLGPAEHTISPGQLAICTVKARDKHDSITVTEKLDGCCVAVAKIDGRIVPLARAGYPAITSPYPQHHQFSDWALLHTGTFYDLLKEGERVVGEWLGLAHGTIYDLDSVSPFAPFDIMRGAERISYDELADRILLTDFSMPAVIGRGPTSIEQAMNLLGSEGYHNATDGPEGAVWRVERKGKFDFLAKYVRPDKVDGKYLANITGGGPVWLYRNHIPNEVA